MYTITMGSWILDNNRNVLGGRPNIVKVNKPTLIEAMQEITIMKENHDMRFSTPYEIINVTSSEETS